MELYDALILAKVPEEQARKAAISIVAEKTFQEKIEGLATKKDLEIFSAQIRTEIATAVNKQTYWIISIAITLIGVMIALKVFG